jgi:hypothetical protein
MSSSGILHLGCMQGSLIPYVKGDTSGEEMIAYLRLQAAGQEVRQSFAPTSEHRSLMIVQSGISRKW